MSGNRNSGRGGIPVELAVEILRMQGERVGPYTAARRLRISYRTAKRVFSGRHPRCPAAAEQLQAEPKVRRCPRCRSLTTVWPCLVCEVRKNASAGC